MANPRTAQRGCSTTKGSPTTAFASTNDSNVSMSVLFSKMELPYLKNKFLNILNISLVNLNVRNIYHESTFLRLKYRPQTTLYFQINWTSNNQFLCLAWITKRIPVRAKFSLLVSMLIYFSPLHVIKLVTWLRNLTQNSMSSLSTGDFTYFTIFKSIHFSNVTSVFDLSSPTFFPTES